MSGPLIETISCKFRGRAECEEWEEKISEQIRTSRQSAVLPSKLSVLPVLPAPPPHVSHCPPPSAPYTALTGWIRDQISARLLTHSQVRTLQSGGLASKHRVEATIYPDVNLSTKSPVVLKEPNPFGYIHYIPSDSSSEYNVLVDSQESPQTASLRDKEPPRSLLNKTETFLSRLGVSNETEDSSECPDQDSVGPWGRRLPLSNLLPGEQRLRVASEGFYSGECERRDMRTVQANSAPSISPLTTCGPRTKLEKEKKISFRKEERGLREESPPNWISCFPSPKTKRKRPKIPDDVYGKHSDRKNESPIKFIDKTPSANSLNLPYCPPVKLDYESFCKVDLMKATPEVLKPPKISASAGETRSDIPQRGSRSVSAGQVSSQVSSQLIVIPVSDQSRLQSVPASPRPGRKERSEVVAQLAGSCTRCDSRRSADSGLTDMTGHSESSQSVTSPASVRPSRRQPRGVTGLTSSSQTLSSLDSSLTSASPHSKSLGDIGLVNTESQPALSDCREERDKSLPAHNWSRTKEIYKTGLYAHWWLNASLTPISEEISDSLAENL